MGSSGQAKSWRVMPMSWSRQRSRIASSKIEESMKRSPMIAILRSISGILARCRHRPPERTHGLSRILVVSESRVIGGDEIGLRLGRAAEQGIDPTRNAILHRREDLLLDGRHHRRAGGAG